jgi:hypothetical protein
MNWVHVENLQARAIEMIFDHIKLERKGFAEMCVILPEDRKPKQSRLVPQWNAVGLKEMAGIAVVQEASFCKRLCDTRIIRIAMCSECHCFWP